MRLRTATNPAQIEELPEWAQLAFSGYKTLNRIQSRIFQAAFYSNENMLVCAPTGAAGVPGRKEVGGGLVGWPAGGWLVAGRLVRRTCCRTASL